MPVLGKFLKWRHARLALQLPLAVLAGILIYDGLRGPQVASMNLAGVLPWIHWRGCHSGTSGGWQRLVHGVPVHLAQDARPALAARQS